ncbi:MAG TPA: hypothetical protein VF756_29180 [Thermoanaerobaculia bacterium]
MNRPFLLPGLLILSLSACGVREADDKRLIYEVHPQEGQDTEAVVQQTIASLHRRLEEFGYPGATIRPEGDTRVSVELPEEDLERVRNLLNETGLLEFRFVRFPETGGAPSLETIHQHYAGEVPADIAILEGEVQRLYGGSGPEGRGSGKGQGKAAGKLYYGVEIEPVISSPDFESARPSLGEDGSPIVEFRLTPEAVGRFARVTSESIGSTLAIVLDGRVISAPKLTSPIEGPHGVIAGNFTRVDAEHLASLLNAGALYAPITRVDEYEPEPLEGEASFIYVVLVFLIPAVFFMGLYTFLMLRKR